MTVKELIEKLQKANQNAEVVMMVDGHAYSVYIVSEDKRETDKESVDVCVMECTKEELEDGELSRYDNIL